MKRSHLFAWNNARPGSAARVVRRLRPRVERLEDRCQPTGNAPSLVDGFGELPLSFETNQGQTDPSVDFLARGNGYTLFLTPGEAVLSLQGPDQQAAVVRMQLVDASTRAPAEGVDELPGRSNYLIGNDPSQWHSNVINYSRVAYRSIYPGIDLVYYGSQRQLEYDFVVAPGADPSNIRLKFQGANAMELNDSGNLVLHTSAGDVVEHAPVIYQEVDGSRQEIGGRYVLDSTKQISFELGDYDPGRPLVIDPILAYSSFLGGNADDFGNAIAVDASGSAYLTGHTTSTNFPSLNPIQSNSGGSHDVFVTKLTPAGNALVYSTYLGGSFDDWGLGIALDGSANAYVTGWTRSPNFPTASPLQSSLRGLQDVFLTKLNSTGSALVYSTYYGSTGDDAGSAIQVDSAGYACLTGYATITGGFKSLLVIKVNPAGTSVTNATQLGRNTVGQAIAVDGSGKIWVAGSTLSTEFPTKNPLPYPTNSGCVILKIDAPPLGSTSVLFSTYFGAADNPTNPFAIAVDADGDVYLTGYTLSTQFPIKNAIQSVRPSPNLEVGFITRIKADGSDLVYSTYLGGNGGDRGMGIALDGSRNVLVTGRTSSTNFPTANALQATNAGSYDAFICKVNPTGSAFVYSTYLGGGSFDVGNGIALDSAGNAYVVGDSYSGDFPVVNQIPGGAVKQEGSDAFVLKLSEPVLADIGVTATASPGIVVQGTDLTFTIQVTATGPADAQTVVLTDTVPNNTTFVSMTQIAGPPFSITTPAVGSVGAVRCTIAALAAQASATFQLVVRVGNSTPFGTVISNIVSGTTASASVTATAIATTPSSQTLIPPNPSVGTTVGPIVVATFISADPKAGSATALVHWGDGETSPGTVAPNQGGGFKVTASKPNPYAKAGSYFFSVAITLNPGGSLDSGAWTPVASLPIARRQIAGAAGSDGRLYALGGYNASGTSNAATAYTLGGSWASVANFPTPRYDLAAATGSDGRLYAFGGYASGGATAVTEAYQPSNDTWTTVASMPTARYALAATPGMDGRLYVLGGFGPGQAPSVGEVYNPANNTWSSIGLPTGRGYMAAATGLDGRIYAIGGRTINGGPSAKVEAYDPVTRVWTTLASLPVACDGLAAATGPDGRIYAIGGYAPSSGVYTARVYVYNPSTNTWASAPPLTKGRAYLAAATGPDGNIYAFGGQDSTGSLTTVEGLGVSRNTMSAGAMASVVETTLSLQSVTPPSPDKGVPVTNVLVAVFTDSNPNAVAANFTALVNWGDGESSTGVVAVNAGGGFKVTATKPNPYATFGSFPFTVTITPTGGTTSAWTQVAPLPAADHQLSAAAGSDGRLYAVGGLIGGARSGAVRAYSPGGVWTSIADMTARYDLAAVTGGDGRLYALGGDAQAGRTAVVEAYSPADNTWVPETSLPAARYALAAAAGFDGRVYALGGITPGVVAATVVYAYSPDKGNWTAVAPMPTGHTYFAAVTGLDGRIYAMGGRLGESGSPASAAVEAYNPATNTWTTLASLPTARYGLAAAVGPDGKIYALGGFAPSLGGYTNTVYIYDPVTNSWATGPSLSTARGYLAAATGSDGKIYALGGISSTGSMTTVESLGVSSASVNGTGTVTIGTQADLAVNMTASASPVFAGQNITYTITLANNGPINAQSVSLSDVLPANTTFVSQAQTSGPAFVVSAPSVGVTGTVAWTLGTMPAGVTAGFLLVLRVDDATPQDTTITNTAIAVSNTEDPSSANNSASANTSISAVADLAATMTASPSTTTPGGDLTYTITVINNGLGNAANVALTDAVPANTTFVSQAQNSGPAFAVSGPPAGGTGTVTWTVAILASGQSATFTLIVRVSAGAANGSTVSNTANVGSTTSDPNPGNNSVSTSTLISAVADLAVDMSAVPASIVSGNNITYTITVINNGPSNAQNVTLSDALPGDTTFVSQAQTNGPSFGFSTPAVGSGGSVIWNAATFATGASATFTLVIRTAANSTPGTTVVNTVVAAAASTDPNAANDSASTSTNVNNPPDVALTMARSPEPVFVGDLLTYTITISNAGTGTATGVTLTDNLPAAVLFVSATFSQGTHSLTGSTLSAAVGTLSAGAVVNGTIVVRPTAPGIVSNFATVAGSTADSNPANNSATATSTINDPAVNSSGVVVVGFEFSQLTDVLVATFTHANGAEPVGSFSASINWGDGTTSPGKVAFMVTTYQISGSHTYTDEGNFNVAVTLTHANTSTVITTTATMLEELLPDGTRGTPNQRFVSEVFRDLLGRKVDMTGLQFWTGLLDRGQSRVVVASGVQGTQEYRASQVQQLYHQYLDRPADPLGLNSGIMSLQEGNTVEHLAAAMAGTAEYFQAQGGGTNDGYIDALYHDALERPADASGLATFRALLAGGTSRDQVASIILASGEYRNLLVAGYYTTYLRRPVDPTGLTYWVTALGRGTRDEEVIAQIVATDEFFARVAP